ncbi:DUF1932 domain-containing protein [Actinomadura luteofluorescens]|uniref:DUF1932 domain-containing protein n=1 Tax=Actinomadura luteofluorescens TaxID=46163 RepID=UPI003640D1BA
MLSVNSAHDAVAALTAGIGAAGDAVWADLNTGSPGLKRELDALARRAGVPFADVAIMAPVPGRGLRTPMLACAGARRRRRAPHPVRRRDRGDGRRGGAAAGRKLLRSVFFKGLAGSVVEALEAARAAGCEDWLRENIVAELVAAGEHTVDRLVAGTYRHAARRAAEMDAAAAMLEELDVPRRWPPRAATC